MYPSTLHAAAAAAEEDSQSASSVMEPKVLRGVMISCHARPTWNYTLVEGLGDTICSARLLTT